MTYDIAIIGAGPGGYVAALKAARLGMKAALIERGMVGGVCLNRGCIPTKALIASARALLAVESASEFGVGGISGKPFVDMKMVQLRKEKIVSDLRGGIERLLKGQDVDLIKGDAKFSGPKKIEVDGRGVDANSIIIATGSSWIELPNLKTDGSNIATSDDALEWTEIPKRLLIVGGGVIGCEFACMMSAFGSKVALVEAMPSILPTVEGAISRLLARSMKARGIDIHTGTTVEGMSGAEMIADKILVAVGRRPSTLALGLEAAGIELDKRGFIRVDEKFQTTAAGVFAIGDAIGGKMLAHEASAEGIAAAMTIAGGEGQCPDMNVIPSPIFSIPEIASVGRTSEELKADGVDFRTGRFPYAATGKALCDGDTEGQAIVLADAKNEKILGVHIFGQGATTLIAEAVLAMRMGCTPKDIERTIHSHPTLSETLAEAAADVYGAAIHKTGRRYPSPL